jgi:amino acid transporter
MMIGAAIFALTGQMAEMTGELFPLAFLSAAIIVGFSAYSYNSHDAKGNSSREDRA